MRPHPPIFQRPFAEPAENASWCWGPPVPRGPLLTAPWDLLAFSIAITDVASTILWVRAGDLAPGRRAGTC